MPPKSSAKGLFSAPKHKSVMYLTQKVHALDKLFSGMSYSDVSYELHVNESTIYTK